jgi:phospholipase D3/4
VIQNIPSKESGDFTDDDTEKLSHDGVIDLRSINFTSLQGSGILHTKLWLVDGEHFYVGSANTDWRSLTQVKELGLMGQNCSCITKDANKIFEVYWALSNASHLLNNWDQSLYASFNISKPAQMLVNDTLSEVYWSSSPPSFSPPQRTDDITALLDVINSSKTFINIAVMDYLPAVVYTKHKKYWPVIDDALRTAAYERGIKVRLLGSCWKHTPRDMVHFMRSLGSWNITGPLGGSIETVIKDYCTNIVKCW